MMLPSLLRLAAVLVVCFTVCEAELCRGSHDLKPEYDYVVVGGGTSGLVVANRLTEDPKSTL